MTGEVLCRCGHRKVEHDGFTYAKCRVGWTADGTRRLVDLAYRQPPVARSCDCLKYDPARAPGRSSGQAEPAGD